uniref:Wntless GOLD domain-containing protein n=1 Tax=Oncorhynchus kisutch TaxID=8019 RepID=A0A8C7KT77_ONCKI
LLRTRQLEVSEQFLSLLHSLLLVSCFQFINTHRRILQYSPSPTMAIHYLATKCVDIHHPHQYHKICDFDKSLGKTIDVNNIVFALHVPLPNKQMSPWFQFLLMFFMLNGQFDTTV